MNAYDFYLKKFTKSVSQPPSGEDVRMNIGSNELPCKPISFSTSCNQDRAAVNKLMIFYSDPSLGNFDYVEKVFRFIRDPCLSSFRSAVELFRRLKEEGLCPYNFTYPFVLKPLDAWERFGKVFDEIPERNRLWWNLKRYDFEVSSKTLELDKEIHEYVRSELGFTTRTGNVVVEYIGIKPDDFTFIVVLTDCVHTGLVDEGCEFFNSNRKIYEIERG
ncbi:pentatricopeptide repeat-containing protein [Pyrus ussuriensis x Pyrus communis]|uniref:Pentatricopeptide repeat-containing protein n=1 Tax=Pyrus ussuriensis x Pyrus communis TaxID=2448454 RepID=A0A5N5H6T7_9ROSA|nr:pentatricopeptide repeat-containing protein [Pyrus ussuriensis x Pyrus communis]